jgi:predicted 3-demethylubiquinone-9 3-methyltransferase (glyoxalase superfamily)
MALLFHFLLKKVMTTIEKITPNLWFDTQAEEAAKFYTSVFPDSGIDHVTYYTKAGQEIHKMKPGSVMTLAFNLTGQNFVALNGGPIFKFNEAVSFIVNCETQEEVDFFWEKLSKDGDPSAQQCGWLKDQFGVSWQIVPNRLTELTYDKDHNKVEKVLSTMMKMKKLIISELEAAATGHS